MERLGYNHTTGKETLEVINISDYGFEWYLDGKLMTTGGVLNLEEDIETLLDTGFTEIEVQ